MQNARAKGDVKVILAELKDCSNTRNFKKGKEVHALATECGHASSIHVATALVNMYAKCGSMVDAHQVFHGIKHPDVVSWTALILGYVVNGEATSALYLFTKMRLEGCSPNSRTFVAALKACSSLALEQNGSGRAEWKERGKIIHDFASKYGYISDVFVQSTLIDMYAKCGSMVDARQVFDSMKHQNVVSWTALIMGYADGGESVTALEMFRKMRSQGCSPNSRTFLAALKAFTSLALKEDASKTADCKDMGKEIHDLASKAGCDSDSYVQSALIDMYAKCGNMADARQMFDTIEYPDVVAWNTLILGYAENGEGVVALDIFARMRLQACLPDSWSFVAALKACTSLLKQDESGREICRNLAKEIHDLASKNGCESVKHVQSTLIDIYSKLGSMLDARQIFNSMKQRDVVSWTALILGYTDNGEGITALESFTRMRRHGCIPDVCTFLAALKACGLLGALEFGKKIHAEIVIGDEISVKLVTCLVDFYGKCGSLDEAQNVFDSHLKTRDLTTWNALLAGYSRMGDGKAVFELFERLQDAGCKPDDVTLTCILTCCSHTGLVEKGKECFETMSARYGIMPSAEHYTCMVDILGRSNKLDDAMRLLRSMPSMPDAVAWMTVLGACRKWRNVEIGRVAFHSLVSYDSRNAAAYVLMAHIYGSRSMWQEQAVVLGNRKKFKAWKKSGESCWTDEMGEVHTFLAGDRKHSQTLQIQDKLKTIAIMMRQHGYVADLMSVTQNITDLEKEEALCGHSERLAIACALINTKPGKTIRIVKNLRVCDDCHGATALISKVEKRTIVCRDANRFHVFKDGKCSCGGFW